MLALLFKIFLEFWLLLVYHVLHTITLAYGRNVYGITSIDVKKKRKKKG